MRYFTTPTVRAARKSVAWSLFFIFLLYSSAPMLATLSKLALMDPNLPTGIIGKSISEVQSIEWVQRWSEVKQVFIADFNGDGILQLNEWFMRGDVVVLATPEVAGATVRNLRTCVCWWYGCCHVNCRWFSSCDIKCVITRHLLQDHKSKSGDI